MEDDGGERAGKAAGHCRQTDGEEKKIATLGLMENTQAELYPSKVRRGSRQITAPMV